MYDNYQVVQLLSSISEKLDTLIAAQTVSGTLLTLLAVSGVLAAMTYVIGRWFKK